MVIEGGSVLVPGTGRFEDRSVLISGDEIAGLAAAGDHAVGTDTEIVDASDAYVVPGFIDSHTHLDVHQTFESVFPHALEGGTTAIVSDTMHMGSLFGARAAELILERTRGLPIEVFTTVPPGPLTDTFGPVRATDEGVASLHELLGRERVLGVSEVDWIHVVGRDSPLDSLMDRAGEEDKVVTAHGAGCSGANLVALSGLVDNDHEALTGDQLVERVENGLHAICRSGTVRDDIGALPEALDRVDVADLSLCTDELPLEDLLEGVYMDGVLRRAIELGVDPIDAIHMVTRSPARHFGLDRGELAPGMRADVVLLSDLEEVAIETVVSGGTVTVEDGEAVVDPVERPYPDEFHGSVGGEIGEAHFRRAAPSSPVRAIQYERELVTSEVHLDPPTASGWLAADPSRDVVMVSLLDRHVGPDHESFVGLVSGLGIETGAVATTQTWEVPGLLVVGVDAKAMVRAAERVVELEGGWAVANGSSIAADLRMDVGGYVSNQPPRETVRGFRAVTEALRGIGVSIDQPIYGISTLTFPGILALRIGHSGYMDIPGRQLVPLSVTDTN